VDDPTDGPDEAMDLARSIARAVSNAGLTCAVAESVTGGHVSAHMAASPDASEWFRGGLVAYSSAVKFDVLGVTPGPVVTAECAQQMATGVRALLAGDIAVATTGAGGPGSAEGQPAGTVFVAVETPSRRTVHGYQLDGDPEQVVKRATLQALRDLHAAAAQMGGQIRGVSPR
jgi:nicotinamide-nucleotide amidase